MMAKLTVALLQMAGNSSGLEANQRKGDAFCRQASARGADIALFPEMWSNGYTLPPADAAPEEVAAWRTQAIDAGHPFVAHFRRLARELDLAIALTYLERWPGMPRNAVSLIDRHGEIRFTYAKVHTCDFDREAHLTPGDAFYVSSLDTKAGEVQVGAMICFDREFPESARILMLKGAEIILTPNACELESHRLCQFRTRAYENMVGAAMTNYARPQNNGHSAAYSPVAFGQDEQPRDTLMVEAGEEEGVYLAVFDLDELRAYRRREVWGDAFRKPRAYGDLLNPDAVPPFVRDCARRG